MRFTNYSLFVRDFSLYGIEYAAKHTAEIGFDAVEFISFFNNSVFSDFEQVKSVKKMLDSFGLAVSCYSMLSRLEESDPSVSLEPVLKNIEYAAILGVPYFHHTVIPGYGSRTMTNNEALDLVFYKTEKIAEKCGEYGITVLYEPQGIYFNGVDGLSTLLYDMKKRHSNVGICGDVGNSLFVDVPPEDVFSAFSKDIKHIHIKDYVIKEPDFSENEQRSISGKGIYSVLPSKGIIDFKKLFALVKGYSGDISMEFCCDDIKMRQSIEYIKSLL